MTDFASDNPFQVNKPPHNPECDGCLERALTVSAIGRAVKKVCEQSEKNGKSLDAIEHEVKGVSSLKGTHERMLLILEGDEENEIPGLLMQVHNHEEVLKDLRLILRLAKWLLGGISIILIPIIGLLFKMALHLHQSGGLV